MKLPSQIRYFNKRYLNRLTSRLIVGATRGPFCMIYHVGRRSGKAYQTPIIAFPTSFGFIIALTYGPQVDWLRNVRAAGCCQILWHRQVYAIDQVEPLDANTALPQLPGLFRTVLGLVRLQDFLKMTGQSPKSARNSLQVSENS